MKDWRPLEAVIERAFEERAAITPATSGEARDAVEETMRLLDDGVLRVAFAHPDGGWRLRPWVKKAILLAFRLWDCAVISDARGAASGDGRGAAPGDGQPGLWYDKIPLKFSRWDEQRWKRSGVRAVPGALARYSAYLAPRVVLMPSFINVGAWVGEGTMVDTWATIGSCAQIGQRCHISGGAGIGGVLEPLQASPVIIEDDCFIGARCEIAEGVVVEKGSVLAMGVFIGASTRIIDRESGDVIYGRVPAGSVVVPGAAAGSKPGGALLSCAVIVKRVDEKTRSRTALNELLRGV